MNSSNRYSELSDEQLQEVHRISGQFEALLREDKQPTIESQIGKAAPEIQHALFQELLEIEIEARAKRDQFPDSNEYLARFPDREAVIEQAIVE